MFIRKLIPHYVHNCCISLFPNLQNKPMSLNNSVRIDNDIGLFFEDLEKKKKIQQLFVSQVLMENQPRFL